MSDQTCFFYTVWKYKLNLNGPTEIVMPKGAEVVSCQFQDDDLCVWALVNTNTKEKEKHGFIVIGTGELLPGNVYPERRDSNKQVAFGFEMPLGNAEFLATVQSEHTGWVYHVFELALTPEGRKVEEEEGTG